MAGKITINIDRCKGCRLCVVACPNNCITISSHSNKKGYFPAEVDNTNCTGCTNCAVICADVAIEVWRDDNKAAAKPSKAKPNSVGAKT